MCGRFTLTADPADIRDAFPWLSVPDQMTPSFNIAPTQPVAVVANNNRATLDFFIWGLIPSWAKDPSIGNRMINARSETLAEKPAFRAAYKYRRCLILADGFYEWAQQSGSKNKTPYYISLQSQKPFAFAGLWENWQSPDGSEIKSAAIITTQPNELITQFHNRMPVILNPDSYDEWLSTADRSPRELSHLLKPYPVSAMHAHPVSTFVNSPANNAPECILPVNG